MHTKNLPKLTSMVVILLGCYDLLRGFMHTVLLQFSARSIAGLDLSTPLARDLLTLLGAFGISNYLTGIMLILIGCYSRLLSWVMLGVIPIVYLLGYLAIYYNIAGYPVSYARWGGAKPLLFYLVICWGAFIASFILSRKPQS